MAPEIDTIGRDDMILFFLDQNNRRIGSLYFLVNDEYEAFVQKQIEDQVIHLSEFDALFSASHGIVINKARVALSRLEFDLELQEQDRKSYIFYLRKQSRQVMTVLILKNYIPSISLMAENGAIAPQVVNDLIDLANKSNNLEVVAILLDYKNKFCPRDPAPELDLSPAPTSEWMTDENEDGTLTITFYRGNDADVTIPSTINGKQVSSLEGRLGSGQFGIFFYNRDVVRSVVIEEGIKVIGKNAFNRCSNLASIKIPESVNKICDRAFAGCSSLVAVRIPDGVQEISRATFSRCSNITSVLIPQSVIKIGYEAFDACNNLVSVRIPEGVQEINNWIFSRCSNLTSVIIPQSVIKIGVEAFVDCTSLKVIEIPGSVKEIGWRLFGKIDVDIRAPKGSYAIQYAEKNGIKYIEI